MKEARIVLGSGSRYRRELMSRLRLPFEVAIPAIDEAASAGETPRATALRLALAKAAAVAARHADALVIGCDQVADLDGRPLNKPMAHAAALEQLQAMQGRTVHFHSALALRRPDGTVEADVVDTAVRFRRLSATALEAYLRADQPYDCAGSARIEALGIALVERVDSADPTALIGLPLIRLIAMLEAAGVAVLPR